MEQNREGNRKRNMNRSFCTFTFAVDQFEHFLIMRRYKMCTMHKVQSCPILGTRISDSVLPLVTLRRPPPWILKRGWLPGGGPWIFEACEDVVDPRWRRVNMWGHPFYQGDNSFVIPFCERLTWPKDFGLTVKCKFGSRKELDVTPVSR